MTFQAGRTKTGGRKRQTDQLITEIDRILGGTGQQFHSKDRGQGPANRQTRGRKSEYFTASIATERAAVQGSRGET